MWVQNFKMVDMAIFEMETSNFFAIDFRKRLSQRSHNKKLYILEILVFCGVFLF